MTREERFEQMLDDVRTQHDRITEQMAQLRAADKTKTVTYRELMGKKLMFQQMLTMYRVHGLID